MGITIHRVKEHKGNLLLRVEIAKKSEFALLQALFRDCISSRLSIESRFGLTSEYKEMSAFRYPLNTVFDLIYEAGSGRVGITYIPADKPEKKD
jgi:hypothetical protein